MTDVPDYVPPAGAPTQAVHNAPAPSAQWQGLSQDQLSALRSQLVTSIIQVVVQAVTGIFVPGGGVGGATGQLTSWASNIPVIGDLLNSDYINQLLGVLGGNTDFISMITNPAQQVVDTLLSVLTGLPVIGGLFGDLGVEFNGLVGQVDDTTAQSADTTSNLNDLFDIFGGGLPGAQNMFSNLGSFLNFDLTSGSFNPSTAATSFIQGSLGPTGLITTLPAIADLLFSMITGAARDSSGDPLADLENAFQHMPFANILGVGGPANIGISVQSGWDQFISGFVGVLGSGASLADAFNVSQQVASSAARGGFAFDIAGIRNNTSLNSGFLPTTQSNIAFDKIALQATAPTFALTQSTAITGYHRIDKASNFGVVSWQGSGVTSITDAYVNIFKMNTTTGLNTLVHSSTNIIGSLSGTMQQNVYSLPTPIAVQAGEVYGIELAIRGAGTHNVAGAATWIPDQTVFPRRFSSLRNSGTSAPPATLTPSYTTNVPFIEFGVSASDVALPHAATTFQFATPGTTSYPVPDWANFVDRIVLGGPGGGHQGGTWGIGGSGGEAAVWVSDTLARGTDFTGATSLTTAVGAGGTAGVGGNGGDGATSTSSIGGTHVLSSAGALGATSFDIVGSAHAGRGPGNYTFPGGGDPWVVAGGTAQNNYGAAGNPLAGAGAGGNWISLQPGGAGAPGVILYRFRQS